MLPPILEMGPLSLTSAVESTVGLPAVKMTFRGLPPELPDMDPPASTVMLLFASRVNVVVPDPPLLKIAPATEITPSVDSVIEVAVKAPPKMLAPRVRPLISVSATSLAPLLFKLTAPVKSLFAWVNVMVAPLVVIEDVPLIKSVPPV
jgi:hypothetical protein